MFDRILKRVCAPEVKILLEKMQKEPELFDNDKEYNAWMGWRYKDSWHAFTWYEQYCLDHAVDRIDKARRKAARSDAYARVIKTLTVGDHAPVVGFREGMRLDASGKLSIGVTPSNFSALQFGATCYSATAGHLPATTPDAEDNEA